jgi:hypothetical protein
VLLWKPVLYLGRDLGKPLSHAASASSLSQTLGIPSTSWEMASIMIFQERLDHFSGSFLSLILKGPVKTCFDRHRQAEGIAAPGAKRRVVGKTVSSS